jgi:hypothetical protein
MMNQSNFATSPQLANPLLLSKTRRSWVWVILLRLHPESLKA